MEPPIWMSRLATSATTAAAAAKATTAEAAATEAAAATGKSAATEAGAANGAATATAEAASEAGTNDATSSTVSTIGSRTQSWAIANARPPITGPVVTATAVVATAVIPDAQIWIGVAVGIIRRIIPATVVAILVVARRIRAVTISVAGVPVSIGCGRHGCRRERATIAIAITPIAVPAVTAIAIADPSGIAAITITSAVADTAGIADTTGITHATAIAHSTAVADPTHAAIPGTAYASAAEATCTRATEATTTSASACREGIVGEECQACKASQCDDSRLPKFHRNFS